MLATRIRVREQIVWLANTHLSACYSASLGPEQSCDQWDDNGEYRAAQVNELRAFLAPLSSEAPVLVGGDSNFTRASRYHRAMSKPGASTHVDRPLQEIDRETIGWEETGESEPVTDRIDYIWSLGAEGKHWHSPIPTEQIMTEEVTLISGRSVPLSDHPALVSEFCLLDERDPFEQCLRL